MTLCFSLLSFPHRFPTSLFCCHTVNSIDCVFLSRNSPQLLWSLFSPLTVNLCICVWFLSYPRSLTVTQFKDPPTNETFLLKLDWLDHLYSQYFQCNELPPHPPFTSSSKLARLFLSLCCSEVLFNSFSFCLFWTFSLLSLSFLRLCLVHPRPSISRLLVLHISYSFTLSRHTHTT